MILLVFDKIAHDGICTAGNFIEVDGAKAIAEALKVPNGSLGSIIMTKGAPLPIGAIKHSEITELDLSHKELGPEDAIILAAVLQAVPNGSMGTLNLRGEPPLYTESAICCIFVTTSQLCH